MVIVISLDGFPAYDLADPKLPIPTIRHLMQTGAAAESMQPINPTWTWPNHTTMITGVRATAHGVLYNGTLFRKDDPLSVKVDPTPPETQMVHCPTLYDVAYHAGLTTAQVDWVAINDAPTITWAFPERANPSDPLIKEMVAKGVLTDDDISNQGHPSILWRDQIWTKAAAYLIRQHHPNLLLFHLLSLDSTHHRYGPRTLASYDAIAFLDSCIKQLVDATKEAGMLDRTTFLVVSDHGFKTVTKQVQLNALLASAHLDNEVQAVAEGGSAMLYIAKPHRDQLLSQLKTLLAGTQGVGRVVEQSEYAALGYPLPSTNPQMPDLLALAKSSYAFSGGQPGAGPVIIVTMARRKGKQWFMGSMTKRRARELDVPLSFLGAGTYTAEIYEDANAADKYPKNAGS
jgi:arylsulfatase A-like enzyme